MHLLRQIAGKSDKFQQKLFILDHESSFHIWCKGKFFRFHIKKYLSCLTLYQFRCYGIGILHGITRVKSISYKTEKQLLHRGRSGTYICQPLRTGFSMAGNRRHFSVLCIATNKNRKMIIFGENLKDIYRTIPYAPLRSLMLRRRMASEHL